MNVTKLEICNSISRKFNNKHINEIKPIIELFLDEILSFLSQGHRIEIRGFGSFSVKHRKARQGRNPRIGDLVNIPECLIPYFKFSREAQNIYEIKKKHNHKKA